MNYRGSYTKLLGTAKSAMIAAVEIYNKPAFAYRDECTVILILNAWELLLKALISKNKESIFYPKKRNHPYRTLSWQDALSKGKVYFPVNISTLPIRSNLHLMDTYRNNAMHFYNAKDFSLVLYALAQTSIINFRDLLRDAFSIDLANQLNWQLLPIGIRPPVDVLSYISGQSVTGKTTAVREFMSELTKAVEELKTANEDTGRLLTVFSVKLESVKKIGESDVVVGVTSGTAQDGPLTIVRTQDPNKSHPLRQKELLRRVGTLCGRRFTSYTFQAILWKFNLKKNSQYCWKATEGVLTRYSNDTVAFIKQLTETQVEDSLSSYRDFCRARAKEKRIAR